MKNSSRIIQASFVAFFAFYFVFLFVMNAEELSYSEPLYETSEIIEVSETSATFSARPAPTIINMGPVGSDIGGTIGFNTGDGFQLNLKVDPAKYLVVFRSQSREFRVVQKDVYDRFKGMKGQKVNLIYREVYRTEYDYEFPVSFVKSRKHVMYEFMNATPFM